MTVPSALSLSWGASSFSSVMQFFGVRAKLKAIDKLDVEAINRKDFELRERLGEMPINLEDMFKQRPQPVNEVPVNATVTDGIQNIEVQRNRLKTIVELANEEKLEDEQS